MSEARLRDLRALAIEFRAQKNMTNARIIDATIVEMMSREQLLRMLRPMLDDYMGVREILIAAGECGVPAAHEAMVKSQDVVKTVIKAIDAVLAATRTIKG